MDIPDPCSVRNITQFGNAENPDLNTFVLRWGNGFLLVNCTSKFLLLKQCVHFEILLNPCKI